MVKQKGKKPQGTFRVGTDIESDNEYTSMLTYNRRIIHEVKFLRVYMDCTFYSSV